MQNGEKRVRDFIAYEYKEVTADPGWVSFFIDGYGNFGWKIDENARQDYPEPAAPGAVRK